MRGAWELVNLAGLVVGAVATVGSIIGLVATGDLAFALSAWCAASATALVWVTMP